MPLTPALLTALALAAPPTPAGDVLLRFADPRINESSGIAAGPDGSVYTHNDSGDVARFFTVDAAGRTTGTHRLTGVQARDWEDMARGPDGTLWLGDIGDNSATRDRGLLVHRVTEPSGASTGAPGGSVSASTFRLRYEDGPQDAEALLVNPVTGQLGIVTKTVGTSASLYLAPLPLQPGPNVLRRAATVPLMLVTGGAVSPQGDRLVLRTYDDAYEWVVPGTDLAAAFTVPPTRIPLPSADQGEAITYTLDGRSLLTSSEGPRAPVHQLTATPAGAPRGSPAPPGAVPAAERTRRPALLGVAIGAVTLLSTALVVVRRGRRRRR